MVRYRWGGNGLKGFVADWIEPEALHLQGTRVEEREKEIKQHLRRKERPVLPERIDLEPVGMEGNATEHVPAGSARVVAARCTRNRCCAEPGRINHTSRKCERACIDRL